MQAREPTYLEAKLNEVYAPVKRYLNDSPGQDPMAVLVAHVLNADATECESVGQCLASEPLLKAGRAYFALLAENDRLPPGEQITESELGLPRSLLLDFFLGRSDIQHRAQEVLGLIERKFSERAFKQATILLQLFETDQTTRIQNERKLFYEDMIQRLGVRRRHPLSKADIERIQQHFSDISRSLEEDGAFKTGEEDSATTLADLFERHPSDEPVIIPNNSPTIDEERPESVDNPEVPERRRGFVAVGTEPGFPLASIEEAQTNTLVIGSDTFTPLVRSLDWLAEQHQLHFCVQVRHPSEVKRWEAIARTGTAEKAHAMLRSVPPARWRAASDFPELPFIEIIGRHMTTAAAREYVRTMTKACYFILLAVGDTGLETYIDTYFGWLEEAYNINGTEFIDRLHRESTLGEQTLQETLDAIFDDFFAGPFAGAPYTFTEGQILGAVSTFISQMKDGDLGEIAPGYFDLGGFLLDHLFEVPFAAPEFPFRLHRIV